MERSFTYQWTPSLLRRVMVHMALRRRFTWVVMAMLVCAAAGGATMMATVNPRGGFMLVAVSFVGLLAMPASLLLQTRFLKRMCDVEVRVTLDGDGVLMSTSSVTSKLQWSGVQELTLHPRMLLLWCAERGPSPVVIPRAAMTASEVDFIRQSVRRAGGRLRGA